MGEVYRATDTKLGREIALKVLPPDMARDPERLARFQREARAVAALSHPHIVTIFSVEEVDSVHFITMELIEGRSLDCHMTEHGLPVGQIMEIAASLAEALAAAHDKGIVHRDLKPSNVMVTTEGRVKVLDFGLAKELPAAACPGVGPADATLTQAGYTQVGVVMGTPAYMSPEQIAGRALDHRSDIFSLGIILYEMVSGHRPFQGTSSAELASAILRDTPRPLTEFRDELPDGLEQLIRCCLEKNAGDRFPSARQLRDQLRGVVFTPPSSTASEARASRPFARADSGTARAEEGFWVAVLPFKYPGASQELTALAEGFTEEIITGLSRFSYLRVIARSSTLRFAHGERDVRSVGKELGARYVIEGSLRQAGSRLRLAVQLVDASSGAHLWAESYDRIFRPEDIFSLQDEIVPRIVSTVADTYGVLPHIMSESLRNRDSESLTPYEAVLRSFAHFTRLSAIEHAAAREALESAVKKAPDYADGWAMLSMLYREEYTHQFNVGADPLGRALSAARRAVESAPSNHLAYHALASAQYYGRDLRAFRISADRALALNPMDGFTAAYMGFLIAYAGDWERGCALAEKARGLNPHHPGWYWFPAFFDAYRKGEYRAALEFALKVNMPGFWRTRFALAIAYGQLGEQEAASASVKELLALRPRFPDEARRELAKWWDPPLVEQLIEGLRKAGLEIPA
jgi:serine/threonine protein kinase/tetratricopeptide (TPR) repeat protein